MSPYRPSRYPRRDLLKWIAALPAVAVASGRVPTPVVAAQATLPASVTEFVAGNTAFALDLYAALRQEADGNLLMSPYSISQALAMTYAGARGETASQMANALSFGAEEDSRIHQAFHTLNADLTARGNAETGPEPFQLARKLRIANALWGERSYPFSAAFIAELERAYGAGLQPTGFSTDPEAAREEINTWVEDQTEDRIQDIVPEDVITRLTRLVLANAVYFYGSWQDPFDADRTTDDTFHRLDGSDVAVPFMVQQEALSYATGASWQAVALSYDGSGFAFTILLPDPGAYEIFEAGLDAATLAAIIGTLDVTEVVLHLPKFEFVFDAGLTSALIALGMVDAFDWVEADFSGMVEGPPPEPLWIDDVLHKAFIGVHEHGTEAAAATAIPMPGGGPVTPPPPIEVRIDRPFLFAIRDTVTGTLLFLGRVLDPSA